MAGNPLWTGNYISNSRLAAGTVGVVRGCQFINGVRRRLGDANGGVKLGYRQACGREKRLRHLVPGRLLASRSDASGLGALCLERARLVALRHPWRS